MRLRAVLLIAALIAAAFPGVAAAKRPRLRATVTLLPGSTLAASVPDPIGVRPVGPTHAPRSSPVAGTLHAKATRNLGAYVNVVDVPFRGSLALASPAPDPLCPGAVAPPSDFEVVSPSLLSVSITGRVFWNLVIRGGGTQLFGCGPAPLSGTTTLPLLGRAEDGVLKHVLLRGQVSDIALPDGSAGRITASLVVRVKLRDRR
ncbi:MAG: hypothetical protein U0869_26335 [Chloroflexota bacterium]